MPLALTILLNRIFGSRILSGETCVENMETVTWKQVDEVAASVDEAIRKGK